MGYGCESIPSFVVVSVRVVVWVDEIDVDIVVVDDVVVIW